MTGLVPLKITVFQKRSDHSLSIQIWFSNIYQNYPNIIIFKLSTCFIFNQTLECQIVKILSPNFSNFQSILLQIATFLFELIHPSQLRCWSLLLFVCPIRHVMPSVTPCLVSGSEVSSDPTEHLGHHATHLCLILLTNWRRYQVSNDTSMKQFVKVDIYFACADLQTRMFSEIEIFSYLIVVHYVSWSSLRFCVTKFGQALLHKFLNRHLV